MPMGGMFLLRFFSFIWNYSDAEFYRTSPIEMMKVWACIEGLSWAAALLQIAEEMRGMGVG